MAKVGRPKGSTNAKSNYARLALSKAGCDPILDSVRCAKALEKDGELAQAGRIYVDLISYLAPKLKSVDTKIEHSGEIKNSPLALSESLQLIADAARAAETVSDPSTRTH